MRQPLLAVTMVVLSPLLIQIVCEPMRSVRGTPRVSTHIKGINTHPWWNKICKKQDINKICDLHSKIKPVVKQKSYFQLEGKNPKLIGRQIKEDLNNFKWTFKTDNSSPSAPSLFSSLPGLADRLEESLWRCHRIKPSYLYNFSCSTDFENNNFNNVWYLFSVCGRIRPAVGTVY